MFNFLETPINCMQLTEKELIRVDVSYGWIDFVKATHYYGY